MFSSQPPKQEHEHLPATQRRFVVLGALLAIASLSAFAQQGFNGLGGYDLLSPSDRAFAFDYDSSGKMDHIVLYRPGSGTIFIEERVPATNGDYYAVFESFNGIGGYDLLSPNDRLIAFDYYGTGKADHILCYRPGTGIAFILENQSGSFVPVLMSFDGIGSYDLLSTSDRIIAFDYDGNGRYDHLVCYRPGEGIVYILQNNSGNLSPEVMSFNGIGGYDLLSPSDTLIAFDYYGIGAADHLVAYRPGSAVFFVLENTNGSGTFTAVQSSFNGVGSYDLLSPQDQLVAQDYSGTGNQNYLLAYRPGGGIAWVIGSAYFTYSPVLQSSTGLGGYDLRSPQDQIFTFDYNSSGYLSALALYRPGYSDFFIESDTNGQITTIVP